MQANPPHPILSAIKQIPKKCWNFMRKYPMYFINFFEILVIVIFIFLIVVPTTRDTFLKRKVLSENLCIGNDDDLYRPLDNITEIEEYFDDFKKNLQFMISSSFMKIYLEDEMNPYEIKLKWKNGTESNHRTIDISSNLFLHLVHVTIQAKLYWIITQTDSLGCTKWEAGTEFHQEIGSFSFKARPLIKRSNCPMSFMKAISSSEKRTPTASNQAPKNRLGSPNDQKKWTHIRSAPNRRNVKKTASKHRTKNISPRSFSTKATFSSSKLLESSPPTDLLSSLFIPQAYKQEILSFCLLIISLAGFIILTFELIKRFKNHIFHREHQGAYKDLDIYEQIHSTIGFWPLIHIVSELYIMIASIVILVDSFHSTQYISITSLRMFAFAAFLSFATSSQWYSGSLYLYQLILLIRASFVRLLNLFIGILPLIIGLMVLGVFIFGSFSEVSKTYMKFLQIFIGLIFGDNMKGTFAFYTDGSLTFDILSTIYVTAMAITSASILFPSFTATISFIHEKEVLPSDEEVEGLDL